MLSRITGKMGDLKRGVGPDPSILFLTADDVNSLFKNVGLTLLSSCIIAHFFNLWPVHLLILPPLLFSSLWLMGCGRSKPSQHDWTRETVLITGGGSGVGALLAHQIAERGARVVVLSITEPEYEPSKSIRVYKCDVSDRGQVQAAAEQIRSDIGHPTIVVNNAGVVKGKLLLDLTEADVRDTFGVNAMAPFWTVQEFLPDMLLKRHGHIVNVSSVMALLDTAQMLDYNASKAATVAFNAGLRNELDYRYLTPEIQTTLVLPAHIKTRMFDKTVLPDARLIPSLTPAEVTQAIIDSLEGATLDNIIRVPSYTWVARLLYRGSDLVPRVVRRLQHWVSGADWAMSRYGPRPDAGERLMQRRVSRGEY